MSLGPLTWHEDLGVHPDGKIAGFDSNYRTHSGHAVRTHGDDLSGTHQSLMNAFPIPVRGGIAFARRGSAVAPEPGTDEMVLCKKVFQIFMGRADIVHGYSPLRLATDRKSTR